VEDEVNATLTWDDDHCLNLRVGPWEFLVAELESHDDDGAGEEPETWGATVYLRAIPSQPDRLPMVEMYFPTRAQAWAMVHGTLGAFGVDVPPLPETVDRPAPAQYPDHT
jgi:hypothetical protein